MMARLCDLPLEPGLERILAEVHRAYPVKEWHWEPSLYHLKHKTAKFADLQELSFGKDNDMPDLISVFPDGASGPLNARTCFVSLRLVIEDIDGVICDGGIDLAPQASMSRYARRTLRVK